MSTKKVGRADFLFAAAALAWTIVTAGLLANWWSARDWLLGSSRLTPHAVLARPVWPVATALVLLGAFGVARRRGVGTAVAVVSGLSCWGIGPFLAKVDGLSTVGFTVEMLGLLGVVATLPLQFIKRSQRRRPTTGAPKKRAVEQGDEADEARGGTRTAN